MSGKSLDLKTRIGVDGEQTYRQALKNINSELRTLRAETTAVTSSFGENQQSVEALTAKQEMLKKQQQACTEKVKLQTELLEIAKKEFGENSEEAMKYRTSLAQAQTALNKCTTELDKTGRELEDAKAAAESGAEANITLSDSAGDAADSVEQLGKGAEDAKKKSSAFGSAMAGVGKTLGGVVVAGAKAAAVAFAAVSAAAAAALAAGFDASKDAGKYADDIMTQSSQTGVSMESLQKWSYASDFIDTSVETMTGSMSRMIRAMGEAADGSDSAQEKFDKLGVTYADAAGNMRSSEDVFWSAIAALGSVENATERDALAMDLFGKSAQELNPLIEAGRAAFESMGDEAEHLGTVFSDEELQTMGGFDDTMNRCTRTASGLKNAIGLMLVPAFQPLVGRATDAMAKVSLALRDGVSPEEVGELVDELLDEAGGAFEDVLSMIDDALPTVTSSLGKLVSALGSKLPGMVDKLLPSAMGLLQSVMDSLGSNAGAIGNAAGQLIAKLASFLVSNIPTLISSGLELVGGIVSGILEGVGINLDEVGQSLGELGAKAWDGLVGGLGSLKDWFCGVWDGVAESVQTSWGNFKNSIVGKFIEAWTSITGGLGSLKDWFCGVWDGVAQSVQTSWGNFKDSIVGKFIEAWTSITGGLGSLKDWFCGVWDGVAQSVQTSWGNFKDSIVGKFIEAWTSITGGLGNLKDWFCGVWDGVEKAVTDAWDLLGEGIKGAFGTAWSAITGVFGSVADIFGGIFTGAADALDKAWNAVKDGVGSVLTGIRDFIYGFFEPDPGKGSGQSVSANGVAHGSYSKQGFAFPSNMQDPQTGTNELGNDIVNQAIASYAGGVMDEIPGITEAVTAAMQAALDAAGAMLTSDAGAETGGTWVSGLASGVTGGKDGLVSSATEAIRETLRALQRAVAGGQFAGIGLTIASGIAMGIRSGAGLIASAAQSAAGVAYTSAAGAALAGYPGGYRMMTGAQTLTSMASGVTPTVHTPAVSTQGTAAPAALPAGAPIDYERIGAAVAQANQRAGVGTAVVVMDGRVVGQSVEPSVSAASASRSTQTIAGRPGQLVTR